MAQVIPFKSPIALGYMVWCCTDEYNEPEGVVYFDSPPKKGDKVILGDKKEWTVVHESDEQMNITVAIL